MTERSKVVIDAIRAGLDAFVFKAVSESALQDQVAQALVAHDAKFYIEREVRVRAGRLDLLVSRDGVMVVLELKLHAAAAPVERQVQRYAKMPEIDAVGVVTTSRRLAHSLGAADQVIGGKPFFVIAVRTS